MRGGEGVNIYEAMRTRTAEKPCLTRESWIDPILDGYLVQVKIMPTNSPECCFLYTLATGKYRRGWEPYAADLEADDWITCD